MAAIPFGSVLEGSPAARKYLQDQQAIKIIGKELEKYGVIPDSSSGLKKTFAFAIAKVQALKKADIKWTQGLSLEFSDDILRAGGSVSAIPFNDLFQQIDAAVQSAGFRVWLILDRLDEIVLGDEDRENVVLKGLLLAYRDISDYANLRSKIFLRDDVYSRVTDTGHFPGLTHIRSRASRPIKWDVEDLLHLVVKRLLTNQAIIDIIDITDDSVKNSEQRRKVFYALFPEKVDKGRAAEGFKWICDRISDGNDVATPRDLLSVLDEARTLQVTQNQREDLELSGMQIFTEDTIRKSVKAVAEVNLQTKIYAEYPDLEPMIKKFAGSKADHNEETLVGLLGSDWERIVKRLERVGFIYRRTRSNTQMWTIPFFYSSALDIKRGAGFELEDGS